MARRARFGALQSFLVWPRAAFGYPRTLTGLADTTVVVTGASSGIGRATAALLGTNGASVVALARPSARLDDVVAQIIADGGRARALECDLADACDVTAAIDDLNGTRIDAIVSNAGVSIHRRIDAAAERSDLQRSLAVNVDGPARLLLGLVPQMAAHGGGTIVNVSTVSAKPPPAPRWGSYQASKAAFDIWLRSAAIEWRIDNIDVRTVYMPLVITPMTESGGLYPDAPALCVDEAARIVTGAVVGGPNRVAPWWLVWQDLAATALPAAFDAAFNRLVTRRRGPDDRGSERR